jgi:hypothetical protein
MSNIDMFAFRPGCQYVHWKIIRDIRQLFIVRISHGLGKGDELPCA